MRVTLAFFSLVVLLSAARPAPADDVPAAAVPAAAPVANATFGYVVPTAVHPALQPSLERFAEDVQTRIAAAGNVKTVALRRSAPADDARNDADICAFHFPATRYVGFIAPSRSWRISDGTVMARAGVAITDCAGNLYYTNAVSREAPRDESVIPQEQIDALAHAAADELIADFAKYRAEHESDWDRILTTGSVSAQ